MSSALFLVDTLLYRT